MAADASGTAAVAVHASQTRSNADPPARSLSRRPQAGGCACDAVSEVGRRDRERDAPVDPIRARHERLAAQGAGVDGELGPAAPIEESDDAEAHRVALLDGREHEERVLDEIGD